MESNGSSGHRVRVGDVVTGLFDHIHFDLKKFKLLIESGRDFEKKTEKVMNFAWPTKIDLLAILGEISPKNKNISQWG